MRARRGGYGLKLRPLRLWGLCGVRGGSAGLRPPGRCDRGPHLIWVIAARPHPVAVVSLGLRPLDNQRYIRPVRRRDPAVCGSPGFRSSSWGPRRLIQGSHARPTPSPSITWQLSGLGGLTIARLWVLGVLAEIVCSRCPALYVHLRHWW